MSSSNTPIIRIHHLTDEDLERLQVVYNTLKTQSGTSPSFEQVRDGFWKNYPNIRARHLAGRTDGEVEREIGGWVELKRRDI
jgi:hypothetical protein